MEITGSNFLNNRFESFQYYSGMGGYANFSGCNFTGNDVTFLLKRLSVKKSSFVGNKSLGFYSYEHSDVSFTDCRIENNDSVRFYGIRMKVINSVISENKKLLFDFGGSLSSVDIQTVSWDSNFGRYEIR
jgi:uncharacterized protein YjbI with pentapeptide repeats